MGWNPWDALAARDDIEFGVGDLPGGRHGMSCAYPDQPVIAIQRGLTQVERRIAVAHELVHLEWGTHCQQTGQHLQVRDEAAVWDEVARRLVDLDELRTYVVRMEQAAERVEPWMVAEEWYVTDAIAERAMRLLLREIRMQVWRP